MPIVESTTQIKLKMNWIEIESPRHMNGKSIGLKWQLWNERMPLWVCDMFIFTKKNQITDI